MYVLIDFKKSAKVKSNTDNFQCCLHEWRITHSFNERVTKLKYNYD